MDQLWAPWRLANAKANSTAPKSDCFVCWGHRDTNDRENLVVYRTELSVVVLNRFPYNNGHLLVCPKRHEGSFEALTTDELLDLQQTLALMIKSLKAIMNPDGFNVGLNLGKAAGAGLPGHLHWHIVPRWNGDTNFMPVLAQTKVISQSLEAFYELLVESLK